MITRFYLFLLLLFFVSCENNYTPRPKGYFRINLPEKKYSSYTSDCPFSFEYPMYSVVRVDDKSPEPCWLNIDFPRLNARIYLSYKAVNNDVNQYIEDARMFAYKHTVKAIAINEQITMNETTRVYGNIYFIEGDAASSTQFFLTDSTHHFIRGALYFSSIPNSDSLAPITQFIREDIEHFIRTFQWEEKED